MPNPNLDPASASAQAPYDRAEQLPRRMPLRVWISAILAFVSAYVFMWSVVHVRADTRPCLAQLPDPLFAIVPHNHHWGLVSHELYYAFTVMAVTTLGWQAIRGEQRPLLRWGVGLTFQAVLRSITMTLLPVCRAGIEAGSIAVASVPKLDLGVVQIPWRVWADNDLIFSGHVGEVLLFYWTTRNWPRPARLSLIVFQIVQAYALLATRGHYTVDLVLAVPCAHFADSCAVTVLGWLSRNKRDYAVPAAAGS